MAECLVNLAKSHAVRGADAVHLASALAVNDPDLVVAVWDRRLHAGMLAAGVRVAPARHPVPRALISSQDFACFEGVTLASGLRRDETSAR